MQGYQEEVAEEVDDPIREASPIAEEPVNAPPQAAMVAHAADDEVNMMQISAAAYTGAADEATISLLIKLHGVPAITLADTKKHKHVPRPPICYGPRHSSHTSSTQTSESGRGRNTNLQFHSL
jgi:hypothetical protein